MGTWISQNITLPKHVTLSEEKENAYSHFIGLVLALMGLIGVIFSAGTINHPAAKTGMIIFALTNVILYASSAFYHYLEPGLMKKIFRVFLHLLLRCLLVTVIGDRSDTHCWQQRHK